TARATVRPPTPESKMPMGASLIPPSLDVNPGLWSVLVLECGQHHLKQGLLEPAQRRVDHPQSLADFVIAGFGGVVSGPGGTGVAGRSGPGGGTGSPALDGLRVRFTANLEPFGDHQANVIQRCRPLHAVVRRYTQLPLA